MTQEMTQECLKDASSIGCLEFETRMLEAPILNEEITLKPIQARKTKSILRKIGRISRLLEKRSKIAILTAKNKNNPRFYQERVPVERIKRRIYDNTPRIY